MRGGKELKKEWVTGMIERHTWYTLNTIWKARVKWSDQKELE